MEKILVFCLLLCALLCAALRADPVFFNRDGSPTADCLGLLDALNFPVDIADANSFGELFETRVWEFLWENSWLDGKYRNARGKSVNFDAAINFFEKMGVLRKKIPSLRSYDYVIFMSETLPEMLLNCKFFAEEVASRWGEICPKPIFVFQPSKLLAQKRTPQGKGTVPPSEGTESELEAFIDAFSGKLSEEFVRNMQSNMHLVPAEKRQYLELQSSVPPMFAVLPLFMYTFKGIAYGMIDLGEAETNILVILSTHNFTGMAESLGREIEVARFPESIGVSFRRHDDSGTAAAHQINIDLAGYEIPVPPSSFPRYRELNEFSMEMFSYFFDLANGEISSK
jgi:hypothetical protein